MSRFHQHLHEDLKDREFAEIFSATSADIALLQALEQALNISKEELAERIGSTDYDNHPYV